MSIATLRLASPREASIRQIDFKNFTYAWDRKMEGGPAVEYTKAASCPYIWLYPLPRQHIRVVEGIHHFYEPSEDPLVRWHDPLVSVGAVTYGDLGSDSTEEAAVQLNYSTGGTYNWDFLYIYTLSGGQTKLLALLGSGSRGDGGLGRVAISDGILALDFNDPDRRNGDCCSNGYVRVRFRWQKDHFVEEGPRERGDWNV
ncbi:MAG: hypothetical protein WCE61_06485 [Candidatus Acidiferrum sp.]